MSNRHPEDDFGLTGLSQRFHDDWSQERSAEQVVANAAAQDAGAAASAIFEDVQLLLSSTLSGHDVGVLWQAATGRSHNLDQLGIEGRDWLRQVASTCRSWVVDTDTVLAPTELPESDETALSARVLGELESVGSALAEATTTRFGRELHGVVPALRRAVSEAGPDLGYRLLLRVMSEYWVPITRSHYDRLVALGDRFGYGEFHFVQISHLTGE